MWIRSNISNNIVKVSYVSLCDKSDVEEGSVRFSIISDNGFPEKTCTLGYFLSEDTAISVFEDICDALKAGKTYFDLTKYGIAV